MRLFIGLQVRTKKIKEPHVSLSDIKWSRKQNQNKINALNIKEPLCLTRLRSGSDSRYSQEEFDFISKNIKKYRG